MTQSSETTTETPKSSMRISSTITESKVVEKEITLPYYCKFGDYYFKVVNEETVIKAAPSSNYASITKVESWLSDKDISKAGMITEEEFNRAFKTVLAHFKKALKK